jgi:putative Mg2+ transporter-C (MgtC) family protein
MDAMSQLEVLAELGLMMTLGVIIGFHREVTDKPAGLRTHMRVAGAAALLVGLGFTLVEAMRVTARAWIAADPIRIVPAIIIGIGFLGIGTMFVSSDDERVHGLTTGSALPMSRGVGVAVALRQFLLAIGAALPATAVLRLRGRFERRLRTQRSLDVEKRGGVALVAWRIRLPHAVRRGAVVEVACRVRAVLRDSLEVQTMTCDVRRHI